MIQDREFRKLCKEVQSEFPELSLDQVVEMVRDAFEFAQNHISEGSLTPIYFQYLGRFVVQPGRKEWLEKKKKNNDSK